MAINIYGPDPNVATWPIRADVNSVIQQPTGSTATGGTAVAVLADNSDLTFITEIDANVYYKFGLAPITLPAGARMTTMSPYVRAGLTSGNTKYKDFLVGQGDHSSKPGVATDNPGSWAHVALANGYHPYSSPNKQVNSAGKLETQADFAKGLYLFFGLNTVYGKATHTAGCKISAAYMRYAYDLPPTANITAPASGGVINDTAAPLIVWDYSDDFQPQAKYQLNIQSGGVTVYDSGLITSSDTFHQVTANLPNGSYTVNLRVYQAWSGPVGGDFPALVLATQPFSINVLRLGSPRLSVASPVVEHIEIPVYPDVNLLDYDAATFDRSVLSYFTSGCTIARATSPVRDGTGSCAMTMTAASGYIGTFQRAYTCQPGDSFKAAAYFNPVALTGRTGQVIIIWLDANNTYLSEADGPTVALSANTWTQVTLTGAVAPANAASLQVLVKVDSAASTNVIYVDDVGLWWTAGTTVIPSWTRGGFYEDTPNLLSYADSTFEDSSFIWTADASVANSVVASSTAQAIHGSTSLNLTRAVTGTGDVQAVLGTTNYLPVTPGASYQGVFSIRSSVARTVSLGMKWYQSNFTPSATATGSVSTTSSAGAWKTNNTGTMVAPADAAYGVPFLKVASIAATSETHYFDALAIYPGTSFNGFWQGYYPNTDSAPALLVEYTDDDITTGAEVWHTLAEVATARTVSQVLVEDYTVRSGVTRTYRATLTETENGISLNSDPSAVVQGMLTLQRVWMHAENDPAGTSYNFQWDGGGRSRTMGAKPTLTDVDGLAYPFAQFGVQNDGSVAVSLFLDLQQDIDALQAITDAKSTAVFRDQRGRSYRGVVGDVQFTDQQYGVQQQASFTFQLAGVQP
jgi:hypothetical protein